MDFADYPARNACKTIGGRLPTKEEIECMWTNRASLGSFTSYLNYWSNKESGSDGAYAFYWHPTSGVSASNFQKTRTANTGVRCVR